MGNLDKKDYEIILKALKALKSEKLTMNFMGSMLGMSMIKGENEREAFMKEQEKKLEEEENHENIELLEAKIIMLKNK